MSGFIPMKAYYKVKALTRNPISLSNDWLSKWTDAYLERSFYSKRRSSFQAIQKVSYHNINKVAARKNAN
jgi:predicted nucleotide-binding protein (sugar kinase/HSP70/actin superfamily)